MQGRHRGCRGLGGSSGKLGRGGGGGLGSEVFADKTVVLSSGSRVGVLAEAGAILTLLLLSMGPQASQMTSPAVVSFSLKQSHGPTLSVCFEDEVPLQGLTQLLVIISRGGCGVAVTHAAG